MRGLFHEYWGHVSVSSKMEVLENESCGSGKNIKIIWFTSLFYRQGNESSKGPPDSQSRAFTPPPPDVTSWMQQPEPDWAWDNRSRVGWHFSDDGGRLRRSQLGNSEALLAGLCCPGAGQLGMRGGKHEVMSGVFMALSGQSSLDGWPLGVLPVIG